MISSRRAREWLNIAVLAGASLIVLWWFGQCALTSGIAEYYSPGWVSSSSENARYRHVFVSAPVVVPSRLSADSVDWVVLDAWVERPTRRVRRWGIIPREQIDSTYRLVVHLVPLTRDASRWTPGDRALGSLGELWLNGAERMGLGGGTVLEATHVTTGRLDDTVRLALRRKP